MVVLGPRSLERGEASDASVRPSVRKEGSPPPSASWIWAREGAAKVGGGQGGPGPGREGPPTYLSWNHSFGWEKLGLVPLPPTSPGQASLRYLVVSWVLSRWSCCRWSWGRCSTGPPGLISQLSGGSTGSRALRLSSHEPAPSS